MLAKTISLCYNKHVIKKSTKLKVLAKTARRHGRKKVMEKGIIIKKENAKKIEAFLKSQQGKARERIFTSATQLEEVIADVKKSFPELLQDKKKLVGGREVHLCD